MDLPGRPAKMEPFLSFSAGAMTIVESISSCACSIPTQQTKISKGIIDLNFIDT
jgi:hypothetical protein